MLLTGDWHIPHQIPNLFSVIDQMPKVQTVVLMGDICDFYQISRYRKDPARLMKLGEELEMTKTALAAIARRAKKVVYLYGNHERRLDRFLADNAPELLSLPGLQLHELLELEKMKIEPWPDLYLELNGFVLTHGDYAGANVGKKYLSLIGKSGACGHTHRLRVESWSMLDDEVYWAETGCLCTQPYKELSIARFSDYGRFHNWQHGYVVIDKDQLTLVKVRSDVSPGE